MQLNLLLLPPQPPYKGTKKSAHFQGMWITLFINIFVYFYKKDCPYCEEMKRETFSDQTVIDLINHNFFPVKIDSRTKDTILYNGIKYSNQQPISHGSTFRHDFYHEVARFNRNGEDLTTTPTVVLFNSKFEKIKVLPGKQAKPLLLRNIKAYIK